MNEDQEVEKAMEDLKKDSKEVEMVASQMDNIIEQNRKEYEKDLQKRADLTQLVTKSELAQMRAEHDATRKEMQELKAFLLRVKTQGKANLKAEETKNDEEFMKIIAGSAAEQYFRKK